jgi:hypothetical protein
MGVGYSVSPLHRTIRFDVSQLTTRPRVKGSDSPIDHLAELIGTNVGVGSPGLYSSTVEEILTWRQSLATKYRDQLEENFGVNFGQRVHRGGAGQRSVSGAKRPDPSENTGH